MTWIFSSNSADNSPVNLTLLKERADQGDAIAHCNYGLCLRYGKGVSIALRNAAHYFKLSADQGNAVG
jgi:TPR repeat protein